MLRTADLEYHLPGELIASHAAEPRDSARLMVVSRSDPSRIDHHFIRDLPDLLADRLGTRLAKTTMVFNATRVLPARLEGRKLHTHGKVSGLFMAEISSTSPALHWLVVLNAGHLHEGTIVELDAPNPSASSTTTGITLRLLARDPSEVGGWRVAVELPPHLTTSTTIDILERVGHTPLPPYILKARKQHNESADDHQDRARYQTVYAAETAAVSNTNTAENTPAITHTAETILGSVAAPTAGMHFTPDLLATLDSRGVRREHVVLHVGSGTFRPVDSDLIEHHPMHAEWCSISDAQAADFARRDQLVLAVGTTSVRTLESYAAWHEQHNSTPPRSTSAPRWLSTRLLITPGYRYRWVDAMLTNFHLPRSTLMAMVAALLSPDTTSTIPLGVERLKSLYTLAVEKRYRFYSYGDAMLILP
jgi:S-adenosylmethionine:tRNA ribosyltransferase-isomerase